MPDADNRHVASFAQLLRAYRHAIGLSQRELAERAEMSPATIRDLEQRRALHPRARSVRALVAALGLTGADAETFLATAREPNDDLTHAAATPAPAAGDKALSEKAVGDTPGSGEAGRGRG